MLTAITIDKISQELSSCREVFLIFDRDGTLVPFAENPGDAILDPRVRDSLNRLACLPAVHVGVLSARSLKQLRHDFPGEQQILAGNCGLEIEFPNGARFCNKQALDARTHLQRAKIIIEQRMPSESMVILEDHGLSLCLHWHKTPELLQDHIHSSVRAIADEFSELHFKKLNTSYEVWPALDWDKSHGLAEMQKAAVFASDEVMLLFAGDSLVDEPAFAWVNRRGGISILVGRRNSLARFAVETPAQLHELIGRLEKIEWR